MQDRQGSATPVTASDDRRLEDRVRAVIVRRVRHGSSVGVASSAGRVTLTGPALTAEHDRLVSEVASVPGVRSVEDRTAVHRTAEAIAGLQRGDRLRRTRLRVAVALAGGVLTVAGGLVRGRLGTAAVATGGALVAAGLIDVERLPRGAEGSDAGGGPGSRTPDSRSRGGATGRMEDHEMQDDGNRAPGSTEGSPSRGGSRWASADDGGVADRDRGDAAEPNATAGPRATPADAPDVAGGTTLLPVGHADLPETGVGTAGEGSGGTEEGITSPATPTSEQLEPSGFDTASSDASPDLTQ